MISIATQKEVNHEFFLSELSNNPEYNYSVYHNLEPDVSIHDDLIHYMYNSLCWIECFNPAARTMDAPMGLNLYGPTVIKSDGAATLYEISKAWSALFKQSPSELRLTGPFGWDDEEGSESGYYTKLSFDRDEVVEKLVSLKNISLKVAKSDDAAFLMLMGI